MQLRDHYDLIVIGGGINGAATANLAAGLDLNVLLVEKQDFAGGTSSRSTKLVHGGLRYLENFEFDLVSESLKERYAQYKAAPDLVTPLEFILPVYRHARRPFWKMRLGVWLYDVLSGKYRLGRHRVLTPREVLENVSGIDPEGLLGGVSYFDAQMDDARLCLENILSARAQGADTRSYTEMTELIKENGRAVGVRFCDVFTKQTAEARAEHIVCTAGPWTDILIGKDAGGPPRLRPTKGAHIVYADRIGSKAVYLEAPEDGRMFFVIPFENHSLIGTTDTDYDGSPDDIRAGKEDVDYLMSSVRRFFPGLDVRPEKIITTFAGVRPLAAAKGNPSKVSRKHVVEQSRSGVVYMMGGKYTTYRTMAVDCLSRVLRKKVRPPFPMPLYRQGTARQDAGEMAMRYHLPETTARHLLRLYGTRCGEVMELTRQDPTLKNPIIPDDPAIEAQIVYAIKEEMARTVDDILWRRLGLAYRHKNLEQARKTVERYINIG